MPVYTYRRDDGTTFDYRQKFLDEPLTVDPATGQHVVRVIQPAGVIFKGSGFYVNDSKSASRSSTSSPAKTETADKSDKTETKTEKTETKAAVTSTESSASSVPAAAAD
jgi:predicted nucleic acid-binding Zn ribbon protein